MMSTFVDKIRQGITYSTLTFLLSCSDNSMDTYDRFNYLYGDFSTELREAHKRIHRSYLFEKDSLETRRLLDQGRFDEVESRLDAFEKQCKLANSLASY